MRERGGRGRERDSNVILLFSMFVIKVTIMNYNNGLHWLTRPWLKLRNEN